MYTIDTKLKVFEMNIAVASWTNDSAVSFYCSIVSVLAVFMFDRQFHKWMCAHFFKNDEICVQIEFFHVKCCKRKKCSELGPVDL